MNGLNDLFGGLSGPRFEHTDLGKAAAAARRDSAKPVPGGPLPQIRGKQIDGALYVRAADVADALESQAPTACARLIKKLRGGVR